MIKPLLTCYSNRVKQLYVFWLTLVLEPYILFHTHTHSQTHTRTHTQKDILQPVFCRSRGIYVMVETAPASVMRQFLFCALISDQSGHLFHDWFGESMDVFIILYYAQPTEDDSRFMYHDPQIFDLCLVFTRICTIHKSRISAVLYNCIHIHFTNLWIAWLLRVALFSF